MSATDPNLQPTKPTRQPAEHLASAATRLEAVENLLEGFGLEPDDPQWGSLTAYIVDAALTNDDATLQSAYNGLQWFFGRLELAETRTPELAIQQGRALGLLDMTRWHLRRSASAVAPSLPRTGLTARLLRAIASGPGRKNQELAATLEVDETQVSRAGRHLRATALAVPRKVGRENLWYITPRGMACLSMLNSDPLDNTEIMANTEQVRDSRTRSNDDVVNERRFVLNTIREQRPEDEEQILVETGLPAQNVAQAMDYLIRHGYVVREPERPDGPSHLRIDDDRYRAIGVTVTPTAVFAVLTTLESRELDVEREEVDGADPAAVIAAIQRLTKSLLQKHDVTRDDIIGIGVNLPGHVDSRQGIVVVSPLTADDNWANYPLARYLEVATDLQVTVDNDVNALALHEQYFGVGQGLCDFSVIFVTPDGEGVGSGLVVSGLLTRGANGIAGEIGHAPLGDPARECRCGNYGCLEATVGFQAIRAQVMESGETPPGSLTEASALVDSGNPVATNAFSTAGRAFGKGIATILNTLNPELLIMSGPVEFVDGAGQTESAHVFTSAALDSVKQHAYSDSWTHCRVEKRSLSGEYAARGAASALLLRRLYSEAPEGPATSEPHTTESQKATAT